MLKRRWPIVFVLLCLTGLGVLGVWKYLSIKAAIAAAMTGNFGPPPSSVVVVPVRSSEFTPTMRVVGTVAAKRTVMIRPEVSGLVTQVAFESGQLVRAGEVLVSLDTAVEQADLKATKARADLARATLARLDTAHKNGALSINELDAGKAELDSANAATERLEALIAKKTIVAPFDARVGLRVVHPGQYLRDGDDIVLLESSGEGRFIDFAIPQELAPALAVGTPIKVHVRSLGENALNEATIPATITARESMANQRTRTIVVRAQVPEGSSDLTPGTSVSVEFARATPRQLVRVPVMAVRRASYGDHVFVIEPGPQDANASASGGEPPMIARQRFVTLGEATSEGFVVLEGLKEGERIAADGSFKLFEGAPVVPLAPEAGPNAALHSKAGKDGGQ